MATYLILNLLVMTVVCIALRARPVKPYRVWGAVLLVLLLLTAVFDNIMIHISAFTYDASKILGLHIGRAPIEDFFYPVLAALIVPTLWNTLEKKDDTKN